MRMMSYQNVGERKRRTFVLALRGVWTDVMITVMVVQAAGKAAVDKMTRSKRYQNIGEVRMSYGGKDLR